MWRNIRQQLFAHRKTLLIANLIAVLSVIMSVPLPMLIPMLVDEVLMNQPGRLVAAMQTILPQQWSNATGYIIAIFLLVILIRLISLGLEVIQSQLFTHVGKDISYHLRARLIDHLAVTQLRDFDTLGSTAVGARCIVDVETIDDFVSRALSRFLINVLTVVGTFVILCFISWELALLLFMLNPAMIMFARSFGQRIRQLKSDENLAFEHFQQALTETLNALQQIKSHRQESQYFGRVKTLAAELKTKAVQAQWKTEAIFQLTNAVYLSGYELFRIVAMFMVLFSGLSIGQMFAVFAYLWFVMGPIQEMLSLQFSYNQADAALHRLFELLKLKPEVNLKPSASAAAVPESTSASICFNNVNFAYETDQPVLKDINLDIAAGAKVAVVAMSGGGKSTLVNLLLGLYEKTSGVITINGVSVDEIGYGFIREHVVTVQQHPIFFNSSIRHNLLGEHTNRSEADIWQALKLAELDNTIKNLPEQLDSAIGRDGVKLSGGQRQRLMIAKMLLNPAPIVILDEALSALDSLTEHRILSNIQPFLRGKTVVMISHRLNTLQHADVIYVLEDGEVKQAGNHQSLMKENGLYNTLYSVQFSA